MCQLKMGSNTDTHQSLGTQNVKKERDCLGITELAEKTPGHQMISAKGQEHRQKLHKKERNINNKMKSLLGRC